MEYLVSRGLYKSKYISLIASDFKRGVSVSPLSPLNIYGVGSLQFVLRLRKLVEPCKGSSFQVGGSILGTPRYVVGVLGWNLIAIL